jgi:hypothetical protein
MFRGDFIILRSTNDLEVALADSDSGDMDGSESGSPDDVPSGSSGSQ